MRKSWLLGFLIVVLSTACLQAWLPPEQGKQGSFVVASAEESRTPVQGNVGPTSQRLSPGTTGSLSLFLVGSLLLGLAAAVRRAT